MAQRAQELNAVGNNKRKGNMQTIKSKGGTYDTAPRAQHTLRPTFFEGCFPNEKDGYSPFAKVGLDDGGMIAVYSTNLEGAESLAKVIAAAPELLEAAEAMADAYGTCECIDGKHPRHCPYCVLRDTIAKARGEA